jgi:hypothetical protein
MERGRDLKEDGVISHLNPYKLGVASRSHHWSRLVVNDLPDGSSSECQCASHLVALALDLYPIAILRRAHVRDMNVCRHASLVAIVPSSNCNAANPINQRSRHGPVNAAVSVDMVLGQQESRSHDAFRGMGQLDIVEQKLVDGAARLPGFPELLNVRKGVGVVGSLCGSHGADRC